MIKDKEKKKKKLCCSGMSSKDKMLGGKKELEWKGNGSGLVLGKEGRLRMRMKWGGDDEELGIEVIELYVNKDLGGVIWGGSFDEGWGFMEKYEEVKKWKEGDEEEVGKMVVGRIK